MGYFGSYFGNIQVTEGGGIQPPDDDTLTRVYGFFEFANNLPAAQIAIHFDLVPPKKTEAGWVIPRKRVTGTVDSAGQLQVDLNMGEYFITCPDLGWNRKAVTLSTDLFDLATLV